MSFTSNGGRSVHLPPHPCDHHPYQRKQLKKNKSLNVNNSFAMATEEEEKEEEGGGAQRSSYSVKQHTEICNSTQLGLGLGLGYGQERIDL